MIGKNERALNRRVMKVSAIMERIVKEDFGLRWWKPKREDDYRLLRLLQWEEKYKVSVRWIVHLLVPIWKKKYSKYQKNGIGVTIATLVGKKSEEILVQSIVEKFPDGEHLMKWRANAQNGQWRRLQEEKRKLKWENPTQAISQYRKAILQERESFRRLSQKMKRRKWRSNPWL